MRWGAAGKGRQAGNFKNRQHKLAYTDLPTPKGLNEKARISARLLQRKRAGYALLQA